jgi:hypothetical protein
MDFFVNDTPSVCVDGVGRALLAAFAAILAIFDIPAQGKKVLPDGNFASRGTAMGVDIDLGVDSQVASIIAIDTWCDNHLHLLYLYSILYIYQKQQQKAQQRTKDKEHTSNCTPAHPQPKSN